MMHSTRRNACFICNHISEFEELRVANIEIFNSNNVNIETLNEHYGKENCVDSDLKTKCKSAIFENPSNPSGFTLELQGPHDVEIKSVTIYSPLEDGEYEPAGHAIKVKTN